MRILYYTLLASFFSLNLAFTQSPYQFSWKQESKYLYTSGAAFTLAYVLNKKTNPLTEIEIQSLSINDINSFDRSTYNNYSETARKWSDYFAFGSIGMPLFFLAGKSCRADIKNIGILWAEANLLNQSFTDLTKYTVRRTRPFAYNDEVVLEKKLEQNARLSFVSGHTSVAAVNSFLFAKIFADHFPDSKIKPIVWTTAALIPALSGYSRVKAGKHFPTDVISGYLLGASIGYFIPVLHRSKNETLKNLSISTGGSGVLLSLQF